FRRPGGAHAISRSGLRQQTSRARNRFREEEKLSPNHTVDGSPRKCSAGVFPETWLRRFFDDSNALVDRAAAKVWLVVEWCCHGPVAGLWLRGSYLSGRPVGPWRQAHCCSFLAIHAFS